MSNNGFKYRSIFISDVHLGMKGTRVNDLISFLKENTAENVFLVGDFIDGLELKYKWRWDAEYFVLIQKLLRQIRKGTKIVYIVGNHDYFMENFIDHDLFSIKVCMEYEYNGALILHGHQFDGLLGKIKWLQALGSHGYSVILNMNLVLNNYRAKFGFPRYPLSQLIKSRIKSAVSYMSDYESLVANYAKSKGFSKVITGHIHNPCYKVIDNVHYYNTGDWVENASVLVESFDGGLQLIK